MIFRTLALPLYASKLDSILNLCFKTHFTNNLGHLSGWIFHFSLSYNEECNLNPTCHLSNHLRYFNIIQSLYKCCFKHVQWSSVMKNFIKNAWKVFCKGVDEARDNVLRDLLCGFVYYISFKPSLLLSIFFYCFGLEECKIWYLAANIRGKIVDYT